MVSLHAMRYSRNNTTHDIVVVDVRVGMGMGARRKIPPQPKKITSTERN